LQELISWNGLSYDIIGNYVAKTFNLIRMGGEIKVNTIMFLKFVFIE